MHEQTSHYDMPYLFMEATIYLLHSPPWKFNLGLLQTKNKYTDARVYCWQRPFTIFLFIHYLLFPGHHSTNLFIPHHLFLFLAVCPFHFYFFFNLLCGQFCSLGLKQNSNMILIYILSIFTLIFYCFVNFLRNIVNF